MFNSSKRKNGVVDQLEAELVASRAKRAKLTERLAGAETAPADAIDARRRSLLEGDDKQSKRQPIRSTST
jgi:hypothetical protein